MNHAGATRMQSVQGNDGAAGAGSSLPKWLKITGIGCAAILLVGGLLVGLGVFRVAACCSEFGELAERAEQVQSEGHEFATELHRGEYERAYERLDDSTRESLGFEAFVSSFEEYRPGLDASRPFPIRLDIDEADFDLSEAGDLNRWYLTTHFGEPQFEELLKLQFVAETRHLGEEETVVEIVDWGLEYRTESFAESRYAETAVRFHDRLARKDFENAYRMVVPEIQLATQGREAFVDEMEPVADGLAQFEEREVYGLFPDDGVETIVVRLLGRDAEGETYFVDYLVNWQDQIYEVSEIEPADVEVDGDDEPETGDVEESEGDGQDVEEDEPVDDGESRTDGSDTGEEE